MWLSDCVTRTPYLLKWLMDGPRLHAVPGWNVIRWKGEGRGAWQFSDNGPASWLGLGKEGKQRSNVTSISFPHHTWKMEKNPVNSVSFYREHSIKAAQSTARRKCRNRTFRHYFHYFHCFHCFHYPQPVSGNTQRNGQHEATKWKVQTQSGKNILNKKIKNQQDESKRMKVYIMQHTSNMQWYANQYLETPIEMDNMKQQHKE